MQTIKLINSSDTFSGYCKYLDIGEKWLLKQHCFLLFTPTTLASILWNERCISFSHYFWNYSTGNLHNIEHNWVCLVQARIKVSWSKEYFHSTFHNRLGVKLVLWWMDILKVVSLFLCTDSLIYLHFFIGSKIYFNEWIIFEVYRGVPKYLLSYFHIVVSFTI